MALRAWRRGAILVDEDQTRITTGIALDLRPMLTEDGMTERSMLDAEEDTTLLLVRAAALAKKLEKESFDWKFTTSDLIEVAKLIQTEEMRQGEARSTLDPTTGRWVKKKA